MRLKHRLCYIIDRSTRNRSRIEDREPLINCAVTNDLFKHWKERSCILLAIGKSDKPWICGPLRFAYNFSKALPELLFRTTNNYPTVGCLKRLERHKRWMSRMVCANRSETCVHMPDTWISEHPDGCVIEREIAIHSYSIAARSMNACEQRNSRYKATRIIDHGET